MFNRRIVILLSLWFGVYGCQSKTNYAVPTNMTFPHFPRDAAAKNLSGLVKLEFTVLPDGSTTNIKIIESQPKGIFDKAAIESIAASEFKYFPKRKNTSMLIQFEF